METHATILHTQQYHRICICCCMDHHRHRHRHCCKGTQEVKPLLCRLSDLDNENREKKENKKYLRMDFLIPVIVITAIWVGCTITYAAMAISNLLSLLKGAALLLFARATYSIYQKYSPAFRRWKKEKSRSAEKKKENEKLQVHSD